MLYLLEGQHMIIMEIGIMHLKLSKKELLTVENQVRNYLIDVSRGKYPKNRHDNLATYKETWKVIYPSKVFGRGNANEVVDWIVNISNVDLKNDAPPLNSLVVRGDTKKPGVSWETWRDQSGTKFKNVEDAQNACWKHSWKKKENRK